MAGWRAATAWTADQHAIRVYGLAGADPCAPPGPIALLRMLGGDLAIHRGSEFPHGEARWLAYADGWSVEIHPGLALETAAVAIAWGITRWYLDSYDVYASETCLSDLPASILLPSPAMRLAVYDGRAAEEIATAYTVPLRMVSARLARCGVASEPFKRSGAFRRA